MKDSMVGGIVLLIIGIILAPLTCYASLILCLIGLYYIIKSTSQPAGSQYRPQTPPPYPPGPTPQHRYPPHHPNYHKQVQREYIDDLRYKQASAKYKSQKKRICPHCDEYAPFQGKICNHCGQDYKKIPDL
jgi:hypothetical protein